MCLKSSILLDSVVIMSYYITTYYVLCNPFCTGALRHIHNGLLFSYFWPHVYVLYVLYYLLSVCTIILWLKVAN